MKRVGIITVIFLTMIGLFAANQTQLLAKSSSSAAESMVTAQRLYDVGQYTQAAQAYEQLTEQGFTDSALYYNLGNAYYKQGDIGRAILNYRRAQQLAPRDPDIEHNLAMARARAVDHFQAAEDSDRLTALGREVQQWVPRDTLAMSALGSWIALVVLVLLYSGARAGSTWRTGLRYALVATAIVLAVGVVALGSTLLVTTDSSEAVVVAAEAGATSGPGAQYVTEFTLHAGAEVNLLETRGSWVRLGLTGEEVEGWVPASAVESVDG
jgi:hypothetical protein